MLNELYVKKRCPECGGKVVYTTNDKIYGELKGNGQCYLCKKCGASVGCHPDGRPLGRLADRQLKNMRRVAHDLFDPLWKEAEVDRNIAYMWLAIELKMPRKRCHFAKFNKWEMICATSILENRPRKEIIEGMQKLDRGVKEMEAYMYDEINYGD